MRIVLSDKYELYVIYDRHVQCFLVLDINFLLESQDAHAYPPYDNRRKVLYTCSRLEKIDKSIIAHFLSLILLSEELSRPWATKLLVKQTLEHIQKIFATYQNQCHAPITFKLFLYTSNEPKTCIWTVKGSFYFLKIALLYVSWIQLESHGWSVMESALYISENGVQHTVNFREFQEPI